MIKYIVKDRNGNELKINQRIPDYTGMWWYFRGCYDKRKLQVVEDLREEKARARYASEFNVEIEAEAKPDYSKITNQGFKVLDLWTVNGESHVICKHGDYYCIGKDYSLSDGTWCHGHYDYATRQIAQKELIKMLYNKYCK